MFNSFKKWVKNEDTQNAQSPMVSTNEGMKTMNVQLQKKFSKGVHFNLKIIIRGDKNVGKTCLWHRLQGHKFVEDYIPTPEIQSASIHWNYKATDDIVKVDVWDVVDKGKKKTIQKNLKISNEEVELPEHVLDAQFLDVYKGSNAVILMFDITKKWTYNYVEKELPKIPNHLPVLILANHRDMGMHRTVDFDELETFVRYADRPPGSPSVMYLESSMKNGFGLKYIHKFLNLPFLLNQRESLLKQLERNHLDVESCLEELQYQGSSEEHNYDVFAAIAKQKPVASSKSEPAAARPQQSAGDASKTENSESVTNKREMTKPTSLDNTKKDLFSSSQMISAKTSTPSSTTTTPTNEKKGFMSRFFGGNAATPEDPIIVTDPNKSIKPSKPSVHVEPVKNIDEFVPDDDGGDFLNENDGNVSNNKLMKYESSSDDDVGTNPMVAGFQEELDSDDDIHPATIPPKQTYYSSSEDEIPVAVQYESETISLPSKPESIPDIQSITIPSQSSEDEQIEVNELEKDLPSLSPDFSELQTELVPDIKNPPAQLKSYEISEELIDTVIKENDDDEDSDNNMVSTVFDDISDDEPSKQPAVAVVLPFQTQTKSSVEEEVESSIKEDNSSETTEKPRKHRKHKKKSKENEEKGERKTKHKSKKSKSYKEKSTPVLESSSNKDLEDFLGGPVVSNDYETL